MVRGVRSARSAKRRWTIGLHRPWHGRNGSPHVGLFAPRRSHGSGQPPATQSKMKAYVKPMMWLAPIVRFAWDLVPGVVRSFKPVRGISLRVGRLIHRQVVRHQDSRYQTHWTGFMRNPPQLEVLLDLVEPKPPGSTIHITSIGCASGAELYSVVWTFRTRRPDLTIVAQGIDISREIVEFARRGVFDRNTPETFPMPEPLPAGLFDVEGDHVRVQAWIRAGITWGVMDACHESRRNSIPPQDIVLANNFLGPMADADADACIRNIVKILAPSGYLVLDGVDLDLRTRTVESLDLRPIGLRIEEVHRADVTKQQWPWTRWGLEPFDKTRSDWRTRYATIFQVGRED